MFDVFRRISVTFTTNCQLTSSNVLLNFSFIESLFFAKSFNKFPNSGVMDAEK
jgi:hypothetical protein